jgi:7-carboxy-7-deazaguanine synthase
MAGCDYRCSWCDTPYARSTKQAKYRLSGEETVKLIKDRAGKITRRVTITGGNPCLHDLHGLIDSLHRENFKIHIETQGSIIPDWLYHVDHVCISPKPPSSGNITDISSFNIFMSSETSKEIKVVVGTEEDYSYAKKVHLEYNSFPFTLQACTIEDPLPTVKGIIEKISSDPDFSDNVKVLPQLHIMLGIK